MEILLTFLFLIHILSLFICFVVRPHECKEIKEELRQLIILADSQATETLVQERCNKILTEVNRKTFHLLGIYVPLSYYLGLRLELLTKNSFCVLLTPVFLLHVVQIFIPSFAKIYFNSVTWIFGRITREEEEKVEAGEERFEAAMYYIVGSFLTILLFDAPTAIAAILFLIFGDAAAAIVGRTVGRTKLVSDRKSLEGSFACFAVCLFISLGVFWHAASGGEEEALFKKIGYHQLSYAKLNSIGIIWLSLFGSLVATIVEMSGFLNDNVAVPLMSGAALTFMQSTLAMCPQSLK